MLDLSARERSREVSIGAISNGGGNAAVDPDDRIRVVIRVRPPPSPSDKLGLGWNEDEKSIELGSPRRESSTVVNGSSFRFDDVFGPDTTQEYLFDNCGVVSLIDSALAGYACTAFAFGQTGSGKTHTISGPDNTEPGRTSDGLLQRSIAHLFEKKRAASDRNITFAASYIEIYKEQVVDLLREPHKPLAVRWKPDKGFHVAKLLVLECNTEDDLLAVLEEGLGRRRTASHEANERSSRSHSILTVYIQSALPSDGPIGDTGYDEEVPIYGSINFVDLAGSERVKATKAEGETLAESNTINKSLLALGNCISALSDPKKRGGYIPYRDSVLTMLLKDSLGGTSRTLMIACVSPTATFAQESSITLRYASRAKRIQNKPELRVEPRQMVILALKREVAQLQTECGYLRDQLINAAPAPETSRMSTDSNSDLVVVTRELVETKGILQKFMADNQELHRENVRLLNQHDEMTRQYEHIMQENETLMRAMQNQDLTMGERSTTEGTLWQQQGHINRVSSRSPSLLTGGNVYGIGLTSDRLQMHDMQMKHKGIDRNDEALRVSLENGLADAKAKDSSPHHPKKGNEQKQLRAQARSKPTRKSKRSTVENETSPPKAYGSMNQKDGSPSRRIKNGSRHQSGYAMESSGNEKTKAHNRRSLGDKEQRAIHGYGDESSRTRGDKEHHSKSTRKNKKGKRAGDRGYSGGLDEGLPMISPNKGRSPVRDNVARANTYGAVEQFSRRRQRTSPIEHDGPLRTKTTGAMPSDGPDWTIPDYNARSKKRTVEEVIKSSKASGKRGSYRDLGLRRTESPVDFEHLDDIDRQIAEMERQLTLDAPSRRR